MNEIFIKVKSFIAGVISVMIISSILSRFIFLLFQNWLIDLALILTMILLILLINIRNNWKIWAMGAVLAIVVPIVFLFLFFFTCGYLGTPDYWGNNPTPLSWAITIIGTILTIALIIRLFLRRKIKKQEVEVNNGESR